MVRSVSKSASHWVRVELLPLGKVVRVRRGTPLQDILFTEGVEFPCGGHGRCKGCKIQVRSGSLPVTAEEREKLSPAELAAGWRLACRGQADGDLQLELGQWEAPVLTDDSTFAFTPQPGLGIAVDVGTTTVVAQLLDLQSGQVLGVRTALNAQAKHGADIMSRIEFAMAATDGTLGQRILEQLIREQIGAMVQDLLSSLEVEQGDGPTPHPNLNLNPNPNLSSPSSSRHLPLTGIVLVGNTVMHHLFCGLSIEPLSHYPFEPESPGLQVLKAADLGWTLPENPPVRFLPCLGSFVGSDILAGVLATGLHQSHSLVALLDLGTNGEIVVGNRERMLCASTAAGPAFEGAKISMGMRAATGAISEVRVENGQLRCHVLGRKPARGICGSGLVDAAAAALDLGWLKPNGRFATGDSLPLEAAVKLTQWDIRELQLAKGAIAAGLRILLEQWGAAKEDLKEVYLAGAFGNYINYTSARRIGLLDFPDEKIQSSGNTALLGAKLALFGLKQDGMAYPEVISRTKHVSLNEDPHFQEIFVEEMGFPQGA
jgi:uncharacterized 2Fe-2S/4Fe-4S cluster protein (DUF4445 family)